MKGKGSIKEADAPVIHERQTNDYNCGPAVLKSVENTMGVGHPNIKTYEAETGANDDDGTPITHLEATAAKHGLKVNSFGQMDINQLHQAVQAGKPVIVAMQMDGQQGGPKGGWEAGHYVVVTGTDGKNVKFMDPSSDAPERSLPVNEFLGRWHDHDHNGKVYQQWGMTLHHPAEVKQAYSGSLGSGATSGQATDPPRLVDASGSTPAGPENQPASDAIKCDSTHLDNCEQDPDPLVFDTAALEKMSIAPFEMMSVGTEDTQEAADNTGAQWTGHSRDNSGSSPWKDRLREITDNYEAHQDSSSAGAGGRTQAPSGPGFQTGQSAQNSGATSAPEADGPSMQLDSDTISTGQVPHLNA
jgi:predicted double-glycine peptidase